MGQVMWGGVAAVLAMYAAFLLVGWLAARKVKEGTASELIVAGRAMPLWIATLTMTATWVDGGYLLGTAEGAYRDSLAHGLQPGVCYGISLILGGLFFAHTMRRYAFTTLIDPFEARYGKHWAAVLFIPAMLGEVFWSAELLVAIGASFGVMLDIPLWHGILVSAAVVTFYTMVGGMWSVAYTDVFQLALIPIGLLIALPFALSAVGGWTQCSGYYATAHEGPAWTTGATVRWWDTSIMLMLGGIPWNCYFQRVLSCQSPAAARAHSLWAGLLTMLLTVPPLLLGIVAFAHWKSGSINSTMTLPLVLKELTPYLVSILGLAAIVGAVTSSFSASILSAGAMASWNVYRPLIAPRASVDQMRRVIRGSIVLLGIGAAVMALSVQSVLELWIFSSDLIFVLLFPQLVMVLYDPRANRIGSMVAFTVSLLLRLGGGEQLLGLPRVIPYPEELPFKTVAAATGLVLLPVVSRLTGRWDPPRALRKLEGTAGGSGS